MIIIFWLIFSGLFVFVLTLAFHGLFSNIKIKESLRTFASGFLKGLSGSGLLDTKKKLPLELYQWETMDDEGVCDDCLERASWPPMDIADWMKEGIPRTPEVDTECGDKCRCRLVPYTPTIHLGKQNKRRY